MAALNLQLKEFRLTTALITYRLPDFPTLFQEYIWQNLDKAPKFPVLGKFLGYWEKNLDGELYSVEIASAELIQPAKVHYIDHGLNLNIH